jgi:chromosome segregation ATPase
MEDEDKIKRQMEFILESQAQFASKMGQLEDIVSRLANASLSRFETLEEKSAQKFEDIDTKIAALVDSQIHAVQRFEDVDTKMATLVDSQIHAAQRFEDVDENIAVLVNSQIRTDESLRNLDERMAALANSQIHTDESLRNLIAVVDRYFSEGRNGKDKG